MIRERTRIKICGIRDPAHARLAAEAGADAIGLVFYGAQPALRARRSGARRDRRGASALRVRRGTLRGRAEREVRGRSSRRCTLDLLQFQGDETPQFCERFGRALRARGAHGAGDRFGRIRTSFLPGEGAASRRACARRSGGHGTDLRLGGDSRATSRSPSSFPAASRAPNVGRAVREVRPWAVDVSSGVEASRGVKDPREDRRIHSERAT